MPSGLGRQPRVITTTRSSPTEARDAVFVCCQGEGYKLQTNIAKASFSRLAARRISVQALLSCLILRVMVMPVCGCLTAALRLICEYNSIQCTESRREMLLTAFLPDGVDWADNNRKYPVR